jgi:hypothetical protein
LFFLDEATALAAGHRPCALCRRAAYLAFQRALARGRHREGRLGAGALDRMLHQTRIAGKTRRQRRFEAMLDDLPDGAMVRFPEDPDLAWLVAGARLLRWRPDGYDRAITRPAGALVEVLTPEPTVLALKHGYRTDLHPTATATPQPRG